MNKIFLGTKNFFLKWFNIAKKLFEEEIFDIIVTVIVSTVLEFTKKTIELIISDGDKPINIGKINDLFCNETYESVLNIILLTLIIWGVTGLAKMMKERNAGKRNKIHTSLMFIVFIVSFIWYILKDLFVIDRLTMMVSGIICGVLFLILCSYFVKNKLVSLSVNKYQSDYRVA